MKRKKDQLENHSEIITRAIEFVHGDEVHLQKMEEFIDNICCVDNLKEIFKYHLENQIPIRRENENEVSGVVLDFVYIFNELRNSEIDEVAEAGEVMSEIIIDFVASGCSPFLIYLTLEHFIEGYIFHEN